MTWATARITTIALGQSNCRFPKEGAYLLMIRGASLYASGIVRISPLELELLKEPQSSRVRVRVRDARTRKPLPRVQVKAKGSDNPEFFSGETDLRGVFVAEGITGQVTAVARQSTTAYTFYRGNGYVGQPPMPQASAAGQPEQGQAKTLANQTGQQAQNAPMLNQALDANLRMPNTSNNLKQIQRLEERCRVPSPSRPKGAAAGAFH